jgi:hypothetical protein
MGVFKTADGRTLVGIGQQDGNEYSGFNGWRDCVIQLTASGATENSVKYLNAIKDYAIAHNAKGESIMPPNLSVWISNNGATTAVQADDIAVDGENVTICGIKWNGTAWDYTDAGKGGGGGSQEPLALQAASTATPPFIGTVSGATKQEILDAWNAGRRVSVYIMGNEVVLTMASRLGSNDPILVGYFMFNGEDDTVFFCRAFTRLSDMAYWVTPFTGLTAIT